MMRSLQLALLGVFSLMISVDGLASTSNPLMVDTSKIGQKFHGIGGLSGGGATTRLLIDYPKVRFGL